jgi:hypothetical protein
LDWYNTKDGETLYNAVFETEYGLGVNYAVFTLWDTINGDAAEIDH